MVGMYDSMRAMESLNAVSLFSGVGGLDLGLERAGIRIVAQCESDAYKRSVLRAHWRDTPCHDDVSTLHFPARPGGVGVGGGTLDAGRAVGPVDDSRSGVPREGADGGGHAEVSSTSGFSFSRGVDLLCGGFPCQDLSVAGNRAGLGGARSGLFHEFARIADALRPTWLLLENVPGLLTSDSGRDFGVVLATLADLGYGIAWRVLDARYFGVPQRRRRVFIVGHSGGDDAPALRALCESCGGDPPTLDCTWQTTRPAPQAGVGGVSPTLTAHHKRLDGQDEAMVVSSLLAKQGGIDAADALAGHLVANTLLRRSGRNQIEETLIASTLRSGSHSEGVSPPGRPDDGNIIAFHPTAGGAKGLSETVDQAPGAGTGNGGQIGIAQGSQVRRLTPVECERLMGWPTIVTIEGESVDHIRRAIQGTYAQAGAACDPSGALRHVWGDSGDGEAVGAAPSGHPESARRGCGALPEAPRGIASEASAGGDLHHLRFDLPAEAAQAFARLQPGVSEGVWAPFGPEALGCRARVDGWTAPAGVKAPDSRRYHACGDGVVANVSEWIGRRIVAEHNANRCARSEPHPSHVWVGRGLRGSWYDGREFPCPGVA